MPRYEGGVEFGMIGKTGAVRIRVSDALEDLEPQGRRVINYPGSPCSNRPAERVNSESSCFAP